MDNREAVNWLINISVDIGKAEHSDLWHYEQALTEIKDMLESAAQLEERTKKRTETHACDLISRQMLLEYIHGEPVGRLLCDKYNLDGLIEQFPPAQPEQKWIPVSERLPEEGGKYLTSVYHIVGPISVFHPEDDTYVSDVAIMKFYDKFPSTVRAWMPLPEPYKEGDADG